MGCGTTSASLAVRVHPLGVDPAPLLARAAEPDVARRRAEIAAEIGELVRPSCGSIGPSRRRTSPAGCEAFRELLRRHPEHRERVVHVALAYPSRQDVADYRRYTAAVQALAAEINAELATPSWTPVQLSVRNDYAASLATLQVGDVLLVNSVRDGMNLVAKEGVLLSERTPYSSCPGRPARPMRWASSRCWSTRSTSARPPRRCTRR